MTLVLQDTFRDYPKPDWLKSFSGADCMLLWQKQFKSKACISPSFTIHEFIGIIKLQRQVITLVLTMSFS